MAELIIIAAAIFGYALVSERLVMSPITSPMVFTAVGLVFGSKGLGWFDLGLDSETVSVLVEATLVLVLFTDAFEIDLRSLRKDSWLPLRLLGLGLPLALLFGTAASIVLFPDFTVAEAVLLAAILAPTDAALGQAVVTDERLPVRLRQGLNVESGLNDGMIVPVVALAIGLAGAESSIGDVTGPSALGEVAVGVGAGIMVGAIGGILINLRVAKGAVENIYKQLGALALAASAYGVAEYLDGNGFIAAFVGGISFGFVIRQRYEGITDFTTDLGELLKAVTFTVFGAVFAGPTLTQLTWRPVVYALVSLFVVRTAATLVSLLHTGTLFETRLFAGWFGPRGLASILFALLALEELTGANRELIFQTASLTVLMSVLLHGMSASAWSGRLAQRLGAMSGEDEEMLPEMMPMEEMDPPDV